MSQSNYSKGIRDLKLYLGFASGTDAYDSAGNATDTEFEITGFPGDFVENVPGEGEVEPLDRGQIDLNDAPMLTDDQAASGTFTVNLKEQTDAANVVLMDILNETGAVSSWASTKNVQPASDRLHCDIKRVYQKTALPSDTHFVVYRRCRLTFSVNTGNPSTISISWRSREVRPTIFG